MYHFEVLYEFTLIYLLLPAYFFLWMKWMNEWKCGDLKCVQKPTRGRLSLTHLPVQPLSMVWESVLTWWWWWCRCRRVFWWTICSSCEFSWRRCSSRWAATRWAVALGDTNRCVLPAASQTRSQNKARGHGPQIVYWVDFYGRKLALLGVFSLPEVFCGPQICQKCVAGRGSAPDPAGGAHDAPQTP